MVESQHVSRKSGGGRAEAHSMGQDHSTDQHILVELDVPEDSQLGQEEAMQVARESFYIELYRRGAIGSGHAAELLHMDRSAFLDLLSAHGVSWFDDTMDVEQEMRN